MLTQLLLSVLLLPAWTSASSANITPVKRQNGDIEVNFGNGNNSITSDIPLLCLEGCIFGLTNFLGCTNASFAGSDQDQYCGYLCSPSNYTGLTQCLNCVIANGEENTNKQSVTEKLTQANQACSGRPNGPSTITEITASPTTTAITATTFTEATLTLPTWTGLESYVAEQTVDPFGNDTDTTTSSGASRSQSGSATSSAPSTTSSSAAPSASTSGAASPVLKHTVASAGGILAALVGIMMI